MTTGTIAACLRADRAIVGAAFLVLASVSSSLAIDAYTEHSAKAAVAAEVNAVPRPVIESPVEQAAVQATRDAQCLAEAIYHEARSEGVEGQKAVAEVILQRVRSRDYPNTICGVVYQGVDRGDKRCQFSFACNGAMDRAREPKAWSRSADLAARIMAGTVALGETDRAIAFHSVNVEPVWASTMLRTRQIGNHVFYRRAPFVPASVQAEEKPAPRSGVLLPDGSIVSYEEAFGAPSSLEIQTDVEVDGAMGNGT